MIPQFRIGFGYDVHQFDENRKLILGGIEIPHSKGLLGHSDADVLLHAICDAMLGALALGDIGIHFPNTDEKYKNADSKILLKNVDDLIHANGYEVSNIDSTILLQKPKLTPYINDMRKTVSEILDISVSQISIKATTTETLGFVGREEGCSAYSIVLLNKKDS
ncbi:2-C-methyl-D-erythritol 2,4-cyclodiphosphate synthase [Melioribacteraceae bacterium 09-Me]|uniref:2-C-methyl-D-erythritol 2,4-cyclodiphosphate synthase n=1 Tax=Stygiobacter electus TaxID=3032292 RepID=A0AAE3P3Y6_9BACT|nr:2-C-methyl-D-erythritol 2,4-cyclodiphosphate synthase [Stygiobacter electus]MDF1612758.1 2-C-methyl-D-erythritol 2,4-cyclodiphosphate synthase [Stygiobacter electus]